MQDRRPSLLEDADLLLGEGRLSLRDGTDMGDDSDLGPAPQLLRVVLQPTQGT